MTGIAEFETFDALALADLVRRREVSPEELLDEALRRVERLNPHIHAVVHVEADKARALIRAGLPEGPFTGVPFLLKDLGAEAIDFPTDSGSLLFKNYRWQYDSEIYLRLRRAGLVTFGRTTSPESGIGPTTESKVYGQPTRNPWNLDHTSGGSSGGAGAVVAAGILPMVHGSDGGGSVRIPASSCGLFGLKPTRARLPDGPASGEGWGGMAIDGFLTRSVRDTAAAIDATEGPDLGAPYVAPPLEMPMLKAIERPPARLKIAVCKTMFDGRTIHPDCVAAIEDAARLCAGLGHEIVEATPKLDITAIMLAWSKVVAAGTALTVRSRAKELGREIVRADVEGVTWAACEYAKSVSGADYLESLNRVHSTGRRLARFMQDYDILLSATLGEPPAKIGRFKPDHEDFLDYRLNQVLPYSPFTAIFNVSGQPAATVPLMWNAAGLPVGVHFAARYGDDLRLMQLCRQLEEARSWFGRVAQVG